MVESHYYHDNVPIMPTQAQSLPTLHLTPEDIAALPATLRKKIECIQSEKMTAHSEWILVGAKSGRDARLVDKTMRALPRIASKKRDLITERNIEILINMLLEGEDHAQIDEDLILDNAHLRASYLKSIPTLDSAKVRLLSGLKPKNKSEPASRWKREGRVFAVRHAAIDLFPAFQFHDDAPRPAIKKILKALPDHLTPWQIAFWFASGNGWLDSKSPQECLGTPDLVIKAARLMNEQALG
jgi:hypothetical protein